MTLTRNDPEDVKASAHLQNKRKMLVETKRINIDNSEIYKKQTKKQFSKIKKKKKNNSRNNNFPNAPILLKMSRKPKLNVPLYENL